MLGNCERRRLMEQYPPDARPSRMLAEKCAAGLAVMFGIAVIGMHSPPEPAGQATPAASVRAVPGPDSRSCAEGAGAEGKAPQQRPGCADRPPGAGAVSKG